MRLSFVVAASGLLSFSAVHAVAEDTVPAAEAGAKPSKVCRMVEGRTGSRLATGRKVCRTAEDWAKVDERGGMGAGLTVEKGTRAKDDQRR